MDIRFIASIKKGRDKNYGIRIMDLDTLKVSDIPYLNAIKMINKGGTIVGLESNGFTIKGNNGDIERYPIIEGGKIVKNNSLIILEQLINNNTTIGYKVADWNGNVLNLKISDVLAYARNNGVANGKIITKDGNSFISSIKGEYSKKLIDTVKRNSNIKSRSSYTIQDLEKEEWTLDDFEGYMKFKNCPYKVFGDELNLKIAVLGDIDILKFPVGVSKLSLESIPKNINVKELILPKTLNIIERDVLYNIGNLDKLYLQDGMNTFKIVSNGTGKNINISKAI